MADPKSQQTSRSRRPRPLEGSEFASLLQKEFKPKTDEAKDAVEARGPDAGRSRRWPTRS